MDTKEILADLREIFGKERVVLLPEEVAQAIGKSKQAINNLRFNKRFPFTPKRIGGRIGVSIYEFAEWMASGSPEMDDGDQEGAYGDGTPASASAPAKAKGQAQGSRTRKQKSPPPTVQKGNAASEDERRPNRPSLGPALINIKRMIARHEAEISFMAEMHASLEAIRLDQKTKKGKPPVSGNKGGPL